MHTIFNRNRYYRDQMKSRKVFKESLDHMKKNDFIDVSTTGNELEVNNFGVWDKMLGIIVSMCILLFVVLVVLFTYL